MVSFNVPGLRHITQVTDGGGLVCLWSPLPLPFPDNGPPLPLPLPFTLLGGSYLLFSALIVSFCGGGLGVAAAAVGISIGADGVVVLIEIGGGKGGGVTITTAMAAANSTDIKTPPSTEPLDMKARFGRITGTSIKEILNYNIDAALECIFQLNDHKHEPYTLKMFAAGHLFEPEVIQDYVALRTLRTGQKLSAPEAVPFCRDRELEWLGASPDYRVLDLQYGKLGVYNLVQCKYWAGLRNTQIVELHGKGCKKDLFCKCPPPAEYRDQIMLEMKTSNLKRNDIAVKSSINTDYVRVIYDPNWWVVKGPIVKEFYEEYLAWYWENDPTKTEKLKQRLVGYNKAIDVYNQDTKHTLKRTFIDIDALLARRPE